jgi:hypothetical protein
MKRTPLLALATLSLLTMSNSCTKESDVTPTATITGRVLKMQLTDDVNGLQPRPRWIVDISPLSLEGKWPGHSYQQAKTFSLPDTALYKAGSLVSFHYQVVLVAQQTPWKTSFEWLNTQAGLGGAEPYAELTCSNVQLLTSSIH